MHPIKNFGETRRVLAHNFLNVVRVTALMDRDVNVAGFENDKLASIKEILPEERSSGIDSISSDKEFIIHRHNRHNDELILASNALNAELKLRGTEARLTFFTDQYAGFDSLLPKITDIFQALETSTGLRVRSIELRKLNVLNYKLSEGHEPSTLPPIYDLLNPSLLLPSGVYGQIGHEVHKTMTNLEWNDGKDVCFMSYGLDGDKKEPYARGAVVLEIGVRGNISRGLGHTLSSFNEGIFDVFMWSLSDKTRQMLDEAE